METPITYVASRILPGDTERIRQHSFTRWMSQDLAQVTVDFCKNIGLVSIYSETSPENLARFVLWKSPEGAGVEIRPGHPEKKFREMDQANIDRGWPLLALHINEGKLYTAIWISPDHYETAVAMLAVYGIAPAQRNSP